MLLVKILILWFALVIVAILNGGFRERVLDKHLDETAALCLSGLLLCALVFMITLVSIGLFKGEPVIVYFYIGICWVLLTLAFEYGFGHYVQGKPWTEINNNFDIAHGNLFLLVMIVTATSPYLSASVKGYL